MFMDLTEQIWKQKWNLKLQEFSFAGKKSHGKLNKGDLLFRHQALLKTSQTPIVILAVVEGIIHSFYLVYLS